MASTVSNLNIAGLDSFALQQSDWIDARALSTAAADTFQAPTGAEFVLFSGNGDFYCKISSTGTVAAVPSTDITDGSASELNPAMRFLVTDQAYISVIPPSSGATVVTMQYFKSGPRAFQR